METIIGKFLYLTMYYIREKIWTIFFLVVLVSSVSIIIERIKDGMIKLSLRTILKRSLFFVTLAVIIAMTIIGRSPSQRFTYNFELFWSYKKWMETKNIYLLVSNLDNVLLFVPFEFSVPLNFKKWRKLSRVAIGTLILATTIEIV